MKRHRVLVVLRPSAQHRRQHPQKSWGQLCILLTALRAYDKRRITLRNRFVAVRWYWICSKNMQIVSEGMDPYVG